MNVNKANIECPDSEQRIGFPKGVYECITFSQTCLLHAEATRRVSGI